MKTRIVKKVGGVDELDWGPLLERIGDLLFSSKLQIDLLFFVYESSSFAIDWYPLGASEFEVAPQHCFSIQFKKDPFTYSSDESLANEIQQFELKIRKGVASAWRKSAKIRKRIRAANDSEKVGLYFANGFPVEMDALIYVCGNRVISQAQYSLSDQISRVCAAFDIEEAYFTGMEEQPTTFYLIEGEVGDKQFLAEMRSISRLAAKKPMLRVYGGLETSSHTLNELKKHFRVSWLSKTKRDDHLEMIQARLLSEY